MTRADLRLVDEICLEMRQYADTLEKLIARNKCQTVDFASNMTEVLVEARKQLTKLMSEKNKACLDEAKIAIMSDLVARYTALEGSLKEIRNDLNARGTPMQQGKETGSKEGQTQNK